MKNLQAVDGRWYDLGSQDSADIILPIAFNDRFFVVLNDANAEVHQRFATLILNKKGRLYTKSMAVILSSSIIPLMAEVLGRRGLGLGALDFPPDDWRYVIIPDVRALNASQLRSFDGLWSSLAKIPPLRFSESLEEQVHWQIDMAVMTILGFGETFLKRVRTEVLNLIQTRLRKATSA